jgi:hypothetical protein
MLVTPEGMVIIYKNSQPEKASLPIFKSPEGRSNCDKLLQLKNDLSSILVILVAVRSIEVKRVDSWNTSAFMAVTLAPRVTLAGIGPAKPISTPFTIIGFEGAPS